MTWTPHRITFQLLAPLHIGWRKSGNLQQTRRYVTGRTFWGALTARLTREGGGNDYAATGKAVDAQLAFTYFYPTTCPTAVNDFFPWGTTQDEFEWRFLHSYASTAVNATNNAAEESSLHETEFIAPHTRDGDPVYLLGYVFAHEDCTLLWQAALDKLQFGGERGYGWGRVKSVGTAEEVTDNKCFGYAIQAGERPVLQLAKAQPILAHTCAEAPVDGHIEVLLGRETQADNDFGGTHSEPQICWEPGGQVRAEGQAFALGEKGIWRKSENDLPSA